MHELSRLFDPKSIAVIGVSRKLGKVGRVIFRNLVKHYKGALYPVNPAGGEAEGYELLSYEDLPEIDLAIFAIPAEKVPESLSKVDARFAVVISGGFGEVGRRDLDERLLKVAREKGTRILGPNCLGFVSVPSKINATFIPDYRLNLPKEGGISIISQSGATLATLLDWANEKGLGISRAISYGNQLDIKDYELLSFLENDEKTEVIGVYVEGLSNGKRFLEIAREVSKPIVVLKSGRTKKGKVAARSHTGALAGEDKIYEGAIKQMRASRARDVESMLNAMAILEKFGRVKGKVGVITCGGGFGVMCVDALESSGIELAEISEETKEKLKQIMPERVVISNPLDLTGDADAERFLLGLKAFEEDENVDVILIIFLFQLPGHDLRIVDYFLSYKPKKPVLIISPPGSFASFFNRKLKDKYLVFEIPEKAAEALSIAMEACKKC